MAWIMIAMERLIALITIATAKEAAAQISTEIVNHTQKTSSKLFTRIIIGMVQLNTIKPFRSKSKAIIITHARLPARIIHAA